MRGGSFRRAPTWILLAIVLIATALRLRGIAFGLPHTQARPDETVIIDAARTLLSGHLPRFYDYPWLYIWMAAASYLGYFVWGLASGSFHSVADMVASWPIHWEPFFLIDRWITALLGIASVVVMYRLGRQLRDEATGLAAAFLLAVAFMHVRNSHFGTTDITMTMFIMAAVSMLVRADATGTRGAYALAGLCAGCAAATKYNALVLGVPFLVVYALSAFDRRRAHPAKAILQPSLIWFGVPFILAFSVGVPFLLFDRERFLADIGYLQQALATGDPRLGLSNGWIHHLQYSLRYGLRLPLLGVGLAGLVVAFVRTPRIAAIAFSFPLAYYAVAGSINLLFYRYALPIVPFLCLSAAYLVVIAAGAVARLAASADTKRLASIVTVALTAAVGYPSAAASWQFDRIISRTDNRVLVTEWFAQNVPAGSSVLQSGARYGHVQFPRALNYRQWVWDGGRLAFMLDGRRAEGRPDWILVQESPLPSTTQDIVKQFLADGYVHERDFHALTLSDRLVYDRLVAFFVPFDGFEDVERPGPNFALYRRVEGTRAPDAARP
jgi:hypothetical protein